MANIQKIKIIFALSAFIFGALFLLGKTSLVVNPFARQMYLNSYLSGIQKSGSIDPSSFWEFRDFYCSNSSHFSLKDLSIGGVFLTFDDGRIVSKDRLASSTNMQFETALPSGARVILQNKSSVVFESKEGVTIRFAKQLKDAKELGAFLKHFKVNTDPYAEYTWYNETRIKK